ALRDDPLPPTNIFHPVSSAAIAMRGRYQVLPRARSRPFSSFKSWHATPSPPTHEEIDTSWGTLRRHAVRQCMGASRPGQACPELDRGGNAGRALPHRRDAGHMQRALDNGVTESELKG